MAYETHDEEFAIFMRKVDTLFVENTGLGYENWPDWNYYDCFDDGMAPAQVFADWAAENWPNG